MRFFWLIGTCAAWAQTGSLHGVVVDETTGEPVPRARVIAQREPNTGAHPAQALSADDGRFEFPALPPANYYVYAQKAGYLFRDARPPVEAAAEGRRDVGKLTMQRYAAIHGVITDTDGEPANHIAVHVSSAKSGPIAVRKQTQTDDRGFYRVAELPAGEYRVVAIPSGHMASRRLASGAAIAEMPTYFPGTPEAALAQSIRLEAGQLREGIDIGIRSTTAVTVSGTLSIKGHGGNVMAYPASYRTFDPTLQPRATAVSSSGEFSLFGLPPGAYDVIAQSYGPLGPDGYGRLRVQVGTEDLHGVRIEQKPFFTAEIATRFPEERGESRRPANVSLVSLEPFGAQNGAQTGADGAVRIPHVPPARYRVYANAGDGEYVESVLQDGQPRPQFDVDLTNGPVPIEVVFGNRPGRIRATVESETELLLAILAPAWDDGAEITERDLRTASIDNRSFQFGGLRPGKYRLLVTAFDEGDELAVWNKAKAKAQEIEIAPNADLQLRIPAPKP